MYLRQPWCLSECTPSEIQPVYIRGTTTIAPSLACRPLPMSEPPAELATRPTMNGYRSTPVVNPIDLCDRRPGPFTSLLVAYSYQLRYTVTRTPVQRSTASNFRTEQHSMQTKSLSGTMHSESYTTAMDSKPTSTVMARQSHVRAFGLLARTTLTRW